MRIVYVAGPYRGPTAWDIAENIRAAERIGLLIARAGAMPLIPHANAAHFHGQLLDHFWLEGTMELLRRCDGAVFLPNWRGSSGFRAELDECRRLYIPHICLDGISEPFFQSFIADFAAQLEDKQRAKEDYAEKQRVTAQTASNRAGKAPGHAAG